MLYKVATEAFVSIYNKQGIHVEKFNCGWHQFVIPS